MIPSGLFLLISTTLTVSVINLAKSTADNFLVLENGNLFITLNLLTALYFLLNAIEVKLFYY